MQSHCGKRLKYFPRFHSFLIYEIKQKKMSKKNRLKGKIWENHVQRSLKRQRNSREAQRERSMTHTHTKRDRDWGQRGRTCTSSVLCGSPAPLPPPRSPSHSRCLSRSHISSLPRLLRPLPFPPSSLSPFISPPHILFHSSYSTCASREVHLPTCGVGGCRVNKSRQMLWRGIKEKKTRTFASFVECLGLNGATVWISHSWLHRWDALPPNCSNIFSLSELLKNYYECILPVDFKGVAED